MNSDHEGMVMDSTSVPTYFDYSTFIVDVILKSFAACAPYATVAGVVTQRDLSRRQAALTAAGTAIVVAVAVSFSFVSYFVALAYVVVAAGYLLLRR
jgi:hypothetical protein